jgi:hypothetical protein
MAMLLCFVLIFSKKSRKSDTVFETDFFLGCNFLFCTALTQFDFQPAIIMESR